MTLRHRVYRELDPAARQERGLSLTNRLLVVLIIVASIQAIAETEPTVTAGRETLFRTIEIGFGVIFAIEYLARLWIAVENPECRRYRYPRLHYVRTPAAVIDFLAIVPTILSFGFGGLFLRLFRVMRILRIAKLGRMSSAWNDLVSAVHSRRHELFLTIALACAAILVSSVLLYLAEGGAQPDKFGSIPRAFWWSVVTLTTVGYGDVYPITILGKFFAALVAVAGIGLIALPTGILAGAFSETVQRRREREAEAAKS